MNAKGGNWQEKLLVGKGFSTPIFSPTILFPAGFDLFSIILAEMTPEDLRER